MNLTLQFVSLDESTRADCLAKEDASVVYEHAAIYFGRKIGSDESAMLQASMWQLWDGEFVRYAGRLSRSGTGRLLGRGDCKVYGFPTEGDRNAFCELTGATPALFLRAVAN